MGHSTRPTNPNLVDGLPLEIALDYILKLQIELIKHGNYNATKQFCLVQFIWEIRKNRKSKVLKTSQNWKILEGGALALRVICAGTRLTVCRALP